MLKWVLHGHIRQGAILINLGVTMTLQVLGRAEKLAPKRDFVREVSESGTHP